MKIFNIIKSHKIIVLVLAVVLVLGALGTVVGFTGVREQKEQDEAVGSLISSVDALYRDDTKAFLAEDVSQEKIDAANSQLEALEGKKLTESNAEKLSTAVTDLGYASGMFALQSLTAAMLDDTGAVAEDVSFDEADSLCTALKKIKPEFAGQQQGIIDEAKAQQTAIDAATAKINALFTDESRAGVIPEVTRDSYNEAATLVNEIRQEAAKTRLTAALETVNGSITAREEAAAAAETQAASAGNSSSGSNGSSGGSGNTSSGGGSSSNSGTSGSGGSGNWWDSLTPGDGWWSETTDGGEIGDNNWSGNGNTWEYGEW